MHALIPMVSLDSNSLTYLVEAMTNGGEPVGEAADEKIAMLRIYFYRSDTLYHSITVEDEYQKIDDPKKLKYHREISTILLSDTPEVDHELIKPRCEYYLAFHSKVGDCRVLSESELGGAKFLLTYDRDFLKHLSGKTSSIRLCSPSEFWSELGIEKGVNPKTIPHQNSPLIQESWWVW